MNCRKWPVMTIRKSDGESTIVPFSSIGCIMNRFFLKRSRGSVPCGDGFDESGVRNRLLGSVAHGARLRRNRVSMSGVQPTA
jgi:hypothetical protein